MSSKEYIKPTTNHFGSEQKEQIEAKNQREQRWRREKILEARQKDRELGFVIYVPDECER
jgi:hypothetical protein